VGTCAVLWQKKLSFPAISSSGSYIHWVQPFSSRRPCTRGREAPERCGVDCASSTRAIGARTSAMVLAVDCWGAPSKYRRRACKTHHRSSIALNPRLQVTHVGLLITHKALQVTQRVDARWASSPA
jgi:hypothetical protein